MRPETERMLSEALPRIGCSRMLNIYWEHCMPCHTIWDMADLAIRHGVELVGWAAENRMWPFDDIRHITPMGDTYGRIEALAIANIHGIANLVTRCLRARSMRELIALPAISNDVIRVTWRQYDIDKELTHLDAVKLLKRAMEIECGISRPEQIRYDVYLEQLGLKDTPPTIG